MKISSMQFLPILLFLFLFTSLPAISETLYVKSYKINILDSPRHRSRKIMTLKRGDQVTKITTQKNWIKISFNNKLGWINKLALSNKPPRKRVSLFSKKVDISSKARKRASTFTSAAAARGLMDSGKDKLEIKEGPDFVALSKLEGVEVDVNQAIEFINEDE